MSDLYFDNIYPTVIHTIYPSGRREAGTNPSWLQAGHRVCQSLPELTQGQTTIHAYERVASWPVSPEWLGNVGEFSEINSEPVYLTEIKVGLND